MFKYGLRVFISAACKFFSRVIFNVSDRDAKIISLAENCLNSSQVVEIQLERKIFFDDRSLDSFHVLVRSASPLDPGKHLAGGLFLPVRPGVGVDDPAAGAGHARAEGRHGDLVQPSLGAEHCLMLTNPARDIERPHAELARIAERHRLDRGVEAGHLSLSPMPH
jgi:hypothetical protein